MEDNLVSAGWLKANLHRKDIIIIDCRFRLSDFSAGKKMYNEGHIPGAYFLDLEEHLSGKKGEHGGRHPLPDEDSFINLMRRCGVHKDTIVIAYDDQMAGSARLWFLLRYIGHDNIAILDGGIQEWVNAGYELSGEIPPEKVGDIAPSVRRNLVADRTDVKNHGAHKIIDCREDVRFRGITEPIDRKAGHIPDAINIPYTLLLKNNHFIDEMEIRKLFNGIPEGSIVYCGSGVTSCINLFAMDKIGLNPRVYAGSWSDWISYEENKVIKTPHQEL